MLKNVCVKIAFVTHCTVVTVCVFAFVQFLDGDLALDAHVHGAGVDLLGGDDRQEHRVREGATPEGGDEDDGTRQQRALGRLVRDVIRHDVHHRHTAGDRAQGQSLLYTRKYFFDEIQPNTYQYDDVFVFKCLRLFALITC